MFIAGSGEHPRKWRMRFLFYSHDGYGLGHTCRNLAIASAVTRRAPKASILLATGSDDVRRLGVPRGVEILKLPSLRKVSNDRYRSRHLQIPDADLRALRAKLLVGAVEAFKPDLLLVDKHPFGASGELKVALAVHRENGGSAVLGLRDILDDPETTLREWGVHQLSQRISEAYDQVLIYGQRQVFDPIKAYEFPEALTQKTTFCGYVHNQRFQDSSESASAHPSDVPLIWDRAKPMVLATVGGGEDGFQLLKLFLQAAAGRNWSAIAVTGPLMPDHHHATLDRLARQGGTSLRSFVPRLSKSFGDAAALVCMGGYNTLVQAMAEGASVVCLPRVTPRLEQWVRAEAFSRHGLLRALSPSMLGVHSLRSEIEAALETSREGLRGQISRVLDLHGAERSAECLVAMASKFRVPRLSLPRSPRSRKPSLAAFPAEPSSTMISNTLP